MKEITLAELAKQFEKRRVLDKNYYLSQELLFLQKGLSLVENDLTLLKKWGIERLLEERKQNEIEFIFLFRKQKQFYQAIIENFTKELKVFYKAIERDEKPNFPEFDKPLNELRNIFEDNNNFLLFLHNKQSGDFDLQEVVLKTVCYSLLLGVKLGLEKEALRTLFYGAVFCDLGFVKRAATSLPKEKHQAAIKALNFSFLKFHTQLSALILHKLSYPKKYVYLAAYHHDYVDGTGAHGAAGEKLSLLVNILNLCQEYVYLTTPFLKHYFSYLYFPKAMVHLIKHKQRYSKQALFTLLENFSLYPPGEVVALNNGQVGIVTAIGKLENGSSPSPVVMMLRDEKQRPLKKSYLLKLDENKALSIYGVVGNWKVRKACFDTLYETKA